MKKLLNFDEAFDRLCQGAPLIAGQVLGVALKRVVWIAEWHVPGCLSENQEFCNTKEQAINTACLMAMNGDEEVPRGMKKALRLHHRFDSKTELYGTVINTISKHTLHDLL